MRFLSIAAAAAVLAGPALAQVPVAPMPFYFVPSIPARIEGMMRDLPRARGPSLQTAVNLAQVAVDTCKAKGGSVSVMVTDSVGTPVVILSGDDAGERSLLITSTKAYTAVKYKMPSGEVEERAKKDPKLAKEIKEDPNIGAVRGGAFLLKIGDELIGAIAVSGFTGTDEVCAQEAIAKVPLK